MQMVHIWTTCVVITTILPNINMDQMPHIEQVSILLSSLMRIFTITLHNLKAEHKGVTKFTAGFEEFERKLSRIFLEKLVWTDIFGVSWILFAELIRKLGFRNCWSSYFDLHEISCNCFNNLNNEPNTESNHGRFQNSISKLTGWTLNVPRVQHLVQALNILQEEKPHRSS